MKLGARVAIRFVLGRRLLLFFLGALAIAILMGSIAEAAPLRVRVRGTAKLVAKATRDPAPNPSVGPGDLVLSGTLADDSGRPLSQQSVTVRLAREADPHDAVVADGIRAARGCDTSSEGSPSAPRRGPTSWSVRVAGAPDAPEVVAVTDEDGRFCFRTKVTPDRYKAHLVYAPPATQPYVDGVERDLVFDLTKRGLTLRFDPVPRIVDLDTPQASIEAVAILDDEETPRVAPRLSLRLANEKEEIARTVTDGSGRAHFNVVAGKLGSPGRGELRVSFDGDTETSPSNHGEEIERRAHVAIKVPAADRGELVAAIPEDGIALVAEVGTSLGPIGEGSVEARVGDVVVATAPVERGIARLLLTFTAQGSEAVVRLRYVPTSPWYVPLGEPTIRLPIRGPSLLSKAPILLAGLAVLGFFLFGRVSAQKNKPEPERPLGNGASPPREANARMDVVRPAERGSRGWTGTVTDAHEETPIEGARVWIERGTFDGRTVVASVETDAKGRFVLPDIGPPAGSEQMGAEARLHARLLQDLPASGEISIALAERRRALLAKLVQWARRRGGPFDVRPEPTPGHVRRVAGAEPATARWADAVERAVFGPAEIDARAELDVERLAPEAREREARDARARGEASPPKDGRR